MFQPLLPDSREVQLHLEVYLRDITDGMRSPWHLPVGFFFSRRSSQLLKKITNVLHLDIEFCFLSRAIEDVGLEALWLAC